MPSTTKLSLNDDGPISVPLRGREPLTLDEPTMRQLAQMHELAAQADEALPALPVLAPDSTDPGDLDALNKAVRARQEMAYSEASPHGQAFQQIVQMLSGEEVTMDELYGWVCSPRALREVLNHFTAPLGGPDESAL
jgi:hypothetical protein